MSRPRKTSARVSEQRSFGPSLEWEGLPIVGSSDPAFRALVWRWLFAGLAVFWAAIIWLVASW